MQLHVRSPAFLLSAFILIIVIATGVLLRVVINQPQAGIELKGNAGALPEVDGGRLIALVSAADAPMNSFTDRKALAAYLAATPKGGILLEESDFVEDPDMLPDYAVSKRFLERQGRIMTLLGSTAVVAAIEPVPATADGLDMLGMPVEPRRSIGALPASFWIQAGSGLVVILIAAVFLALRPLSFAVGAFAFAGLGITGAAYTAAIYSSRQLAMDPGLIEMLSILNHVFTVGFGIGIIGLFSVYPVRIADPRFTALPAAVISYGAIMLYRLRALPHDVAMLQNVVALLLVTILVMVGLQYRATKGRPADRAALMWLGLSVVFGASTFVMLVIIPVALGHSGIVSQAFGFILLATIYVGTAFAVSRYRLFDIGRWSFRILLYAGMILALLTIDLALILALQMPERTSLAAASVIMVLVYFPLRDLLHERFFRRSRQDRPDLYRQAMATAYKFGAAAQQRAWVGVLEQAFQPGHVEAAASAPARVTIANEGIEMHVPAYPWTGGVSLGFAAGGRRLFARQDAKLVEELAEVTSAAHADRLSYEKGAEEERRRIARDLHDDVGATLLSGLHAEDESRRQETLVEALSDIRRIAHDLAGRETVTERFIAQIRHETRARLQANGVTLDWPLGSADDDLTVLPYRFHHNLSAMIREAISNALKHGAGAVAVTCEVAGQSLEIVISNLVAETAGATGDGGGIGLRNIAARAGELGGRAEARAGAGRFVVSIILPLPGSAA